MDILSFTALFGILLVILNSSMPLMNFLRQTYDDFELVFSIDELFKTLYGRLTVILNLSLPLMNCLQLCMAELG